MHESLQVGHDRGDGRRIATALCLAWCLAGCGIGRFTYLAAETPASDVKYLHQYVDGGTSESPVGVELEVSGLRVTIWPPRVGFPPTSPFPVCVRSRELLLLPPVPWIFTSEAGAKLFQIEISVVGEGAALDPSKVTLETRAGETFPAHGAADPDLPGAWLLRFDAPCSLEQSYELRIDGLSKGGKAVVLPRIRFAPASEWRLEAI